jgi:hypothetical protein
MTTDDTPQWTLAYEAEGTEFAAWTLRYGLGLNGVVREVTDQYGPEDTQAARSWGTQEIQSTYGMRVESWQPHRPGPGTSPDFWTAVRPSN